ncbi:Uncharacterised protein [Mycobacteroides abscessus subsp. abscessus]|nr:Uncharacterised protein [Mycobacteroides abscessus subsp. abscessus]
MAGQTIGSVDKRVQAVEDCSTELAVCLRPLLRRRTLFDLPRWIVGESLPDRLCGPEEVEVDSLTRPPRLDGYLLTIGRGVVLAVRIDRVADLWERVALRTQQLPHRDLAVLQKIQGIAARPRHSGAIRCHRCERRQCHPQLIRLSRSHFRDRHEKEADRSHLLVVLLIESDDIRRDIEPPVAGVVERLRRLLQCLVLHCGHVRQRLVHVGWNIGY